MKDINNKEELILVNKELKAEIDLIQSNILELKKEIDRIEEEKREIKEKLDSILNSRSYKFTQKIMKILRRK